MPSVWPRLPPCVFRPSPAVGVVCGVDLSRRPSSVASLLRSAASRPAPALSLSLPQNRSRRALALLLHPLVGRLRHRHRHRLYGELPVCRRRPRLRRVLESLIPAVVCHAIAGVRRTLQVLCMCMRYRQRKLNVLRACMAIRVDRQHGGCSRMTAVGLLFCVWGGMVCPPPSG